ncbi:PREDICTED: 50S ribosomal protein L22, chloroplastic-like [Lupinus angustifolius]|uniref:50S ribosomal protein L22, chloroplastic-like n=1 Tax=Lupinus angustifolius TaxID=3871 RepID=UPI00092F5236|nr:PREDICTED: 50S ribosomal protein L22, chloroplastic-like [Lupinus angustifolius]
MALSFSQSSSLAVTPLNLKLNLPFSQFHSQLAPKPLKFPFPSIRIQCTSFNDKTLISPITPKSPNPGRIHAVAQLPAPTSGQESAKSYVEAYAIGRNLRMSADKARRVVDQIRGRSYEETLMILEFMPYRACESIIKIVFSAGANASNNLGLSKGSLVISKAEVNEGKTMKRMRAGARGRAHPFKKRTCHVAITVKGLASESVVEAKSA